MRFRHSQSVSTPISSASLSPFEAQRGFGELPTIAEADSRPITGHVISVSNNIPQRLTVSQQNSKRESWLERFGVKARSPAAISRERISPGTSIAPDDFRVGGLHGGSHSGRPENMTDLEKGNLAELPSRETLGFPS